MDDWENVTKNLQLVQLPSKTPASLVLDDFAAEEGSRRRPGSAEADILEEIIQGVKEYFNKSLGRILLYRFERQQFHELFARIESSTSDLAGKALCDVYGGEHLLRLFGELEREGEGELLSHGNDKEKKKEKKADFFRFAVSMPELIAQTNMDHQSVTRLKEELTRMTLWLARERQTHKYFAVEYENPGQEYVGRAKGSD